MLVIITVCQFTTSSPACARVAYSIQRPNAVKALGPGMPKILCNCPVKMRMAIPLVNPFTTWRGMSSTMRPSLKTPIKIIIAPAITVVNQIPVNPCWLPTTNNTAAIAPVGPLTWLGVPDNAPIISPAKIAVTNPAAPLAPDANPNASDSGTATAATFTPANRSFCSKERL